MSTFQNLCIYLGVNKLFQNKIYDLGTQNIVFLLLFLKH